MVSKQQQEELNVLFDEIEKDKELSHLCQEDLVEKEIFLNDIRKLNEMKTKIFNKADLMFRNIDQKNTGKISISNFHNICKILNLNIDINADTKVIEYDFFIAKIMEKLELRTENIAHNVVIKK